MLDKLAVMHQSGFLMLDLKPNNVLVGDYGNKQMHKIRLIDFGISKPYLEEDGTHIKMKKQDLFMGSFIFASVNNMNYKT